MPLGGELWLVEANVYFDWNVRPVSSSHAFEFEKFTIADLGNKNLGEDVSKSKSILAAHGQP